MKKIGYILGLVLIFSMMIYSCKDNSLEVLRQNEINTLDKYVKDHHLEDAKDPSGIYFKLLQQTNDSLIKSGYQLKIDYNITLMDSTLVFTTEDQYGHNYEEDDFYVDVSNSVVNQNFIQQIAGMHIAFKKMHIGEKAFVIIPSELAFKAVITNTGYVSIPRFSTLLVTVYVKKGYAPKK